jgi:hypothetical protein
MQIGDKVWIFDSNHRCYEDNRGNKLDRCWYRGYFVERYIVGETKQSWLVGHEGGKPDDRWNIKVNKKTLTYPGSYGKDGRLYISEEEIDRACWLNDNQYRIREDVGRCRDYEKLKKIDEILKTDKT